MFFLFRFMLKIIRCFFTFSFILTSFSGTSWYCAWLDIGIIVHNLSQGGALTWHWVNVACVHVACVHVVHAHVVHPDVVVVLHDHVLVRIHVVGEELNYSTMIQIIGKLNGKLGLIFFSEWENLSYGCLIVYAHVMEKNVQIVSSTRVSLIFCFANTKERNALLVLIQSTLLFPCLIQSLFTMLVLIPRRGRTNWVNQKQNCILLQFVQRSPKHQQKKNY